MHLWGQPPNFSSRRDVRWGVALVTSREMAAPETLRVAANVLRLKGRTLLVPALATTVLLVMLVVGRTFARETVTRAPGNRLVDRDLFASNAAARPLLGLKLERVHHRARVPSVYPGWVVRVYHDIDLSQPGQSQLVCRVACRYDNVDFCDVRNLPGLGDLSKKFGMIWRFMPLADDTVERFIVRDLDSLIGSRERAAVDEWIASNKTFHAMRDAPAHGTEILGGMWGGWNRHNDIYRRVRQRIINSTQWKFKGLDQRVLTVVLWPHIVKHRDLIAHDSYLCWYYPMSKPFPTQRKSPHDFVGSPSLIDKGFRLKTHCSYFCRPRDHKDWVWC
ncbi:uncharacterized protein LOC119090992 [Pollicipes pollicipes]|uniref:uncharacterized protein LOC119090992 n=1 Tax=Pollicipes pollicipes TaxID=41117 RepID=UPI0018850F41|nr:uncharacterized protein LOC119090992 [Pollicipes pollicipes]